MWCAEADISAGYLRLMRRSSFTISSSAILSRRVFRGFLTAKTPSSCYAPHVQIQYQILLLVLTERYQASHKHGTYHSGCYCRVCVLFREKADITAQFKFPKLCPNAVNPRMCHDKISEVIYLWAMITEPHVRHSLSRPDYQKWARGEILWIRSNFNEIRNSRVAHQEHSTDGSPGVHWKIKAICSIRNELISRKPSSHNFEILLSTTEQPSIFLKDGVVTPTKHFHEGHKDPINALPRLFFSIQEFPFTVWILITKYVMYYALRPVSIMTTTTTTSS